MHPVVQNIMLEATDLDLGSVYVMGGAARLNDDSELQKELGIDPAFQTSVIVPVGKIGEKRKQRIVQIVIKLQFIN